MMIIIVIAIVINNNEHNTNSNNNNNNNSKSINNQQALPGGIISLGAPLAHGRAVQNGAQRRPEGTGRRTIRMLRLHGTRNLSQTSKSQRDQF